ncbi:MAG TPA: hypothetical protein VMV43_11645 [Candidatus Nanopelagicaceae bacterium]|nr:hypothetical protein [Candidatus Nanopelagicaceae bacterium]
MERDYDIGLRIYQEKVQNQQDLPKEAVEIIEKYINQGVIPLEAKILAHFSVLAEVELARAEISEDVFKDEDDMCWICNFIINSEGHVIELYLHHTEEVFLTLLPKMLCSLEYLEVICFPNNLMKVIPEWISDLQFLRVLDVNNVEQPNPEVPDSIMPFLNSLESFNEFYK